MALDLSSVGFTTEPHSYTYDWKNLALYALGIGAKRDELAYLYEGSPGGIASYPTFAVIPAHPPLFESLVRTGGNLAMVVHGGQKIRSLAKLPPSGTLLTTATIRAIYDMKKLAQVVIDTRSTLGSEPVFETTWAILFRGEGGFSGPRPPADPDEPSMPKDREPSFTHEETTSPEQALLYRQLGDYNPLHADPEFAASVGFPQGPILHGLCTYGFAARAVIKHLAGGDASRLRMMSAQFRRPVWPGDTIVTQGFLLEGGKVALHASVKGRSEPVLTSGYAEIV
ncbi:MAG: MaoC family protein [Polyangiaceae bacterium]|nr:MaoC family protein [Polyangiaceae bacterium]